MVWQSSRFALVILQKLNESFLRIWQYKHFYNKAISESLISFNKSEQLSHLRKHVVGYNYEQAALMIKQLRLHSRSKRGSNYCRKSCPKKGSKSYRNFCPEKGSKSCRKSCPKKDSNFCRNSCPSKAVVKMIIGAQIRFHRQILPLKVYLLEKLKFQILKCKKSAPREG